MWRSNPAVEPRDMAAGNNFQRVETEVKAKLRGYRCQNKAKYIHRKWPVPTETFYIRVTVAAFQFTDVTSWLPRSAHPITCTFPLVSQQLDSRVPLSSLLYKYFIYLQEHSYNQNIRDAFSVLCEAEPALRYFIGAPVLCVVVGNVPRVRWRLDNGVVAGNTLNTHTHSWLECFFHSVPIKFLSLSSLPPPPLRSPEIGPSCLLRRIRPAPAGGLSAIWRKVAGWLRPAGRPCGPSSGPGSQTDSGCRNSMWRTARRDHPPSWPDANKKIHKKRYRRITMCRVITCEWY